MMTKIWAGQNSVKMDKTIGGLKKAVLAAWRSANRPKLRYALLLVGTMSAIATLVIGNMGWGWAPSKVFVVGGMFTALMGVLVLALSSAVAQEIIAWLESPGVSGNAGSSLSSPSSRAHRQLARHFREAKAAALPALLLILFGFALQIVGQWLA